MTGSFDNREVVYRNYDNRIAELEAESARLRSLVSRLVEDAKLVLEDAKFHRSGWTAWVLNRYEATVKECEAAVKEAHDGK